MWIDFDGQGFVAAVVAVVATHACKDFCEIPASHELADHLVDDRAQDAVAGLVAFLVYEDC
jgi:hypothetical protein